MRRHSKFKVQTAGGTAAAPTYLPDVRLQLKDAEGELQQRLVQLSRGLDLEWNGMAHDNDVTGSLVSFMHCNCSGLPNQGNGSAFLLTENSRNFSGDREYQNDHRVSL